MIYIFFDIDGVLTNGKKYYGLDGIPFSKTFFDKDFTALKQAMSAGIEIAAISGDERINREVMRNRNIDFYFARSCSKWELISQNFNINHNDITIAVGDDIFDLDMLEQVTYACCPKDSHPEVLEFVKSKVTNGLIIDANGGSGVIVKMIAHFLQKFDLKVDIAKLYDLDRDQKF